MCRLMLCAHTMGQMAATLGQGVTLMGQLHGVFHARFPQCHGQLSIYVVHSMSPSREIIALLIHHGISGDT